MLTKRKKIYFKFFLVFFFYLVIEMICFVFIKSGYIPARLPTFSFVWKNPSYPIPMADIDSLWGTWHYKEDFRSQNGCIFFDYHINSYGARDVERQRKSNDKNRVIVLGDSFTEGYGLDEKDRLSNLLQKKTGKEFLNFSCADFGLTQEYLVYKHLAKDFDHSVIFIAFLPFNDFENDDPEFLKGQNRYKPYFFKTDTGFKLDYYKQTLNQSDLNKKYYEKASNSFSGTTARFLRAFTCWFNIVDYFNHKKVQTTYFTYKKNKVVSYYFDYTPEHLAKLRYILNQLRIEAPEKKIIFCTLPVIPDIIRRNTDGEPPLPKEINKICSDLNIQFIDLLPYFYKLKNYRNYYFFCDSHWNENANLLATDILYPYFRSAGVY
jgi:hypothetical protein